MSKNNDNTIIALLAGAAIGAGLGILFSPNKGSKIRENIKYKFDEAKDKFNSSTFDINETITNVKENIDESFDSIVSNLSYNAEDVISFLEKKLALLKEQNSKFQK
jgi:gas vesicle protein